MKLHILYCLLFIFMIYFKSKHIYIFRYIKIMTKDHAMHSFNQEQDMSITIMAVAGFRSNPMLRFVLFQDSQGTPLNTRLQQEHRDYSQRDDAGRSTTHAIQTLPPVPP